MVFPVCPASLADLENHSPDSPIPCDERRGILRADSNTGEATCRASMEMLPTSRVRSRPNAPAQGCPGLNQNAADRSQVDTPLELH